MTLELSKLPELQKQLTLARSRAARFKKSQKESESLLEDKSRELYKANQQLENAQSHLQEEVKLATQKLRDTNQRLHQSLDEKSKFIGAISHEIRTPLNAIIGLSELLDSTHLDQEQKEHIDIINKSASSLMSLINEILEITQIDVGNAQPNPTTVNMAENISFINNLFKLEAQKRGLALRIEQSTVPDYLSFDVRRYNQIVNNLVSNAFKHTEKGSITISYHFIADDNNPKNGQLTTEVHDTGKGISPENQKIIFNLYEQIGNPNQGIGLGLAICQKLCTLMQGQISCSSEMGVGSTFSFTLPTRIIKQAKPTADTTQTSAQDNLTKSLKILIAEDNLINQRVISAQLKQLGQQADIVDNGQLALEKLQQNEYDLVLLDILMPVMNGEETIQKIRANPDQRVATQLCVALTAASFQEQGERLLAMGFDRFLSKPLTLENLTTTLQQATAQTVPATTLTTENQQPQDTFEFLKQQFGDDFASIFQEVAPLFMQETKSKLQELSTAIEQQQTDDVRFIAHALKGEAAAMGLNELSTHFKTIEKTPDGDALNNTLLAAEQLFQQHCHVIQNQLGQSSN